jgi:hypothetical protein
MKWATIKSRRNKTTIDRKQEIVERGNIKKEEKKNKRKKDKAYET